MKDLFILESGYILNLAICRIIAPRGVVFAPGDTLDITENDYEKIIKLIKENNE